MIVDAMPYPPVVVIVYYLCSINILNNKILGRINM